MNQTTMRTPLETSISAAGQDPGLPSPASPPNHQFGLPLLSELGGPAVERTGRARHRSGAPQSGDGLPACPRWIHAPTNRLAPFIEARERANHHGLRHGNHRLGALATVAALMLWGAGWSGANPLEHTITLSPSAPEDEWQVDLQPEMSAKLTVNIESSGEAQGRNWQLRGAPSVDVTGDQILWSGSMTGNSGEFTVVNTAPGSQAAVVKVSCEWVPSGGGGGGGGGSPPVIEGLATGVASPSVAQVSWSFHPSRQLADGFSAINWALFFYDSQGQPVSTVVDEVEAVSLNPSGASWTVVPGSGSGSTLSGTVTSGDESTGRMRTRYSTTEESTSESVLSFGAEPYLEIFTPLE